MFKKTMRKGLWNRLTQSGVEPLTALAIAYACYPSSNQPHTLVATVGAREASGITESVLDRGTIDIDTCCQRLFGMSADEVEDSLPDDHRLAGAGGTLHDALAH